MSDVYCKSKKESFCVQGSTAFPKLLSKTY